MVSENIYEGIQEIPEELLNEKDRVLDDGEQDLEDEAREMLNSWNLEKLLSEAKGKIYCNSSDDLDLFNAYDGETSFEDLKKEMTLMEGMTSIWFKMVKENKSGERVKANRTVLYDQVGFLEYSLGPFDSSLNSGRPTFLDLNGGEKNKGRTVMAWELACLTLLREGEVANFLVHPSIAYGSVGSPPVVPPDAYLYYTIKMHKTWEISKLDEYSYLERSIGHIDSNITTKLEAWMDHKRIAGNYMRDGLTKEALVRYRAAVSSIEEFERACANLLVTSPEYRALRQERLIPLKVSLMVNAAIAANRKSMPSLASKFAFEAKTIDPKQEKAYYQLIKARLAKGDFLRARRYFEEARKNCGKSSCFDALKLEMDFKIRDDKAKTDDLLKRMSSAFI